MKKLLLHALFLIPLALLTNKLSAQTFDEVIKLAASDRAAGDQFGYSVAVSGDYAIVGAYLEDEDVNGMNTLNQAGSAYIFERNVNGAWQQVQKIVASDRSLFDQFGFSVSISGDYAVVGAKLDNRDVNGTNLAGDAGSAYIFERNVNGTWQQAQKIVASDRASNDQFGGSVSISGDYVIIGAQFEDEDASGMNTVDNTGSVYIFERDAGGNWQQAQKIVASDRNEGDYFGNSVSISGDYAIVGALFEDEDTNGMNMADNAGSAYIFERDAGGNWQQAQKIVASDRASNDQFGISVSISSDYAIIGARFEDQDANGMNTVASAGSAYIFERDAGGNWQQAQKIVASDRDFSDYFGSSVSISGSYAIVGAYLEDQNANGTSTASEAGSAYIYQRNASGIWQQSQKLVASDRSPNDQFGIRVSISGENIIIGAFFEDQDANGVNTLIDAGSAYIFERSIIVPVEISYFKGEVTEEGALLRWETASEISNSGYEVQRSDNGKIFKTIGFVSGNGTTIETQTYHYLDGHARKGVNYYRLKQIDFSGMSEYSKVIAVDMQKIDKLASLNSNIVQTQLTIHVDNKANIYMMDAMGRKVQEFVLASTTTLDLEYLPTGIYYLLIKVENQTEVIPFIKQ